MHPDVSLPDCPSSDRSECGRYYVNLLRMPRPSGHHLLFSLFWNQGCETSRIFCTVYVTSCLVARRSIRTSTRRSTRIPPLKVTDTRQFWSLFWKVFAT